WGVIEEKLAIAYGPTRSEALVHTRWRFLGLACVVAILSRAARGDLFVLSHYFGSSRYDQSTGAYLGSYSAPLSETVEGIAIGPDHQLYLAYNNGLSGAGVYRATGSSPGYIIGGAFTF